MVVVVFLPGDGTTQHVEVNYISDFARDKKSQCAFCHGDPRGEFSLRDSDIAQYYERNSSWAVTCPMCGGRPS